MHDINRDFFKKCGAFQLQTKVARLVHIWQQTHACTSRKCIPQKSAMNAWLSFSFQKVKNRIFLVAPLDDKYTDCRRSGIPVHLSVCRVHFCTRPSVNSAWANNSFGLRPSYRILSSLLIIGAHLFFPSRFDTKEPASSQERNEDLYKNKPSSPILNKQLKQPNQSTSNNYTRNYHCTPK